MPALLRLALALWLAIPLSCAMAPQGRSHAETSQEQPRWLWAEELPGERLRLSFEPVAANPVHAVMQVEEARAVLVAFLESLPQDARFQVVPARSPSMNAPAAWERRMREEFLSRYGPALLPMPESVQHSPLFMALRLSPRYMGPGIREAAQELFRSPVFLTSVVLSVLVYFAAWALPEPIFSKSFAAALTVRLALAVGLLELRNVALACLHLYRDAQAARSVAELEAVAERFGRALGGAALRVLVLVASFGVAKGLPKVPPGGLGPLLNPPRYAVAGGMTFQAAATAHMVADGTLVVAGVAMGVAGPALGSACADGIEKKNGYQWHHLATNKNDTSMVHGGPWTPLFAEVFGRAEMSLDAPENLVYLKEHKGPHPEEYHEEVLQRLQRALGQCRTTEQCRRALVKALRALASDVCTSGSRLHRLVTRSGE